MSEDPKGLMPEVLPVPHQAQDDQVRERVVRHLRNLLIAGAATGTVAATSYGVVDMLPPPARCQPAGGMDASAAWSDTTGSRTILLEVKRRGEFGLASLSVISGADRAWITSQLADHMEVQIVPSTTGGAVTIDLRFACEGPGGIVRAVIVPKLARDGGVEPDIYVTLRPQKPDGGF